MYSVAETMWRRMVGELKKWGGVEIVCKEEAAACKPGTMLALAGDTEKNNEHWRQNIRSSGICLCRGPPHPEYDA